MATLLQIELWIASNVRANKATPAIDIFPRGRSLPYYTLDVEIRQVGRVGPGLTLYESAVQKGRTALRFVRSDLTALKIKDRMMLQLNLHRERGTWTARCLVKSVT
jgi:hypothetical protein